MHEKKVSDHLATEPAEEAGAAAIAILGAVRKAGTSAPVLDEEEGPSTQQDDKSSEGHPEPVGPNLWSVE